MKKSLLLAALVFSAPSVFSQQKIKQVSNSAYDLLKSQGKLDATVTYSILPDNANSSTITNSAKTITPGFQTNSLAGCSCIVPLDTIFSIAAFTNGVAPTYRNDDGSTNSIALPFSFSFYGTNYNNIYINNNGNISFGNPSAVFSSTGFPNNMDVMIAPLWADVDTRNVLSGIVHYKITPTALIVKWDSVGYYSQHVDKLCNFQLIITDGTDPILPTGNNVGFCYGDMGWTTGDASSGIGGFGGVPATVGVNKGDGINYYQVGLFDSTGFAYDGSGNLNDGIDFLDYKSIYFDASPTTNTPASAFDTLCDTVPVYLLTNYNYSLRMLAWENGQTLSYTVQHAPAGLTVNQVASGNYLKLDVNYSAQNTGLDSLILVYQDNGIPFKSKIYKKYFSADLSTSAEQAVFSQLRIYPNPSNGILKAAGLPAGTLVSIYSVVGEKVAEKKVGQENTTELNLSELPGGIYLLHLKSEAGVSTYRKIILE